jgi:hypothetical protein
MLVDTAEKLQKRRNELEAKDIARIKRWKDEKKAAWLLQANYGIDCDLILGTASQAEGCGLNFGRPLQISSVIFNCKLR